MIFRYFDISQETCRKVVCVQGQHTEFRMFSGKKIGFSRTKRGFSGKKLDLKKKSVFEKKNGISFSPEMFHNKTIFGKKIVNGHGAIVSSSPAGLSCSRNRTNGRNGFGVLNDIG